MVFGRFSNSPSQAPKSGIDRGRYLVEHVSLCGDCHTPRNFIGAPKRSLYLAGADKKIGPLGEEVPNITPDKETGIGDWKREDIVELSDKRHQAGLGQRSRAHGRGHRARLQEHDQGGCSGHRGLSKIDPADQEQDQIVASRTIGIQLRGTCFTTSARISSVLTFSASAWKFRIMRWRKAG